MPDIRFFMTCLKRSLAELKRATKPTKKKPTKKKVTKKKATKKKVAKKKRASKKPQAVKTPPKLNGGQPAARDDQSP